MGVAVRHRDLEVIQLLLDRAPDPNTQEEVYNHTLTGVVMVGYREGLQLLLNRGADVNARQGCFGTVLHIAVLKGRLEAVRLLLDNGADVHAQHEISGTPLQSLLASATNQTDIFPIIELLLDHGADITTYVPDSPYGDALTAAKARWKQDRDSLDAFMKLVASRGKKGDLALRERKRDIASADSNEELEDSQKPKRRRV